MNTMFQLLEIIGNNAGASNKARADVNFIAEKLDFKTVSVHSPEAKNSHFSKAIGKVNFELNLHHALKSIGNNSVLLVQVPILNLANRTHKNILDYCSKHHIRVISFIHDVNELRGTNAYNNQPFYDLLKYSAAVISHNKEMSKHLVSKGISPDKIVNLEIFDYLLEKDKDVGYFKKQIVIGGNLDVEKVKYLRDLNKIKGCRIVLYGPNYTTSGNSENIEYKGVVDASELPYMLNGGFGLVWDGESIESCTGWFGNYLKYNNPHKLSMYIASGLPVIIWDQAAEAYFVRENDIGFTVKSLMELESFFNSMEECQYSKCAANVKKIQNRIGTGFYADRAIKSALKIVVGAKDNEFSKQDKAND